MQIWLFSSAKLLAEINTAGAEVKQVYGIHCATNFIPSVALDGHAPSSALTKAYTFFTSLDEMVSAWPCFRRLACSTVILPGKDY
jgi:hypothetical protein